MRTKKKDASITEEIAGSTSVSSSTTTGTAPPVMDNLRLMIPESLQHGPFKHILEEKRNVKLKAPVEKQPR